MNPDVVKLILSGMMLAGVFTLVVLKMLHPETFVALVVGLGLTSPLDFIKNLTSKGSK